MYSIIGRGCIVSIWSIVDYDVAIGRACHVNQGVIVMSEAAVDGFAK